MNNIEERNKYLEFYRSELGAGKHCTKSFGLAVWQHQQAKVEEANAKAQMCRDEKNHAINRWSVVCKERDELQKRLDRAVELMQKPVIVGEPSQYVCSRFKEIEQALKGEG